MAESQTLRNIERSNDSNVLWPPVAEALDTMIRRADAGAGGFERTWRLIHVWEAMSAALTAAAVSKLRALGDSAKADYLSCREQLHGRSWDPISRSFKTFQGALDGSTTRRIDVLWHLSNFRSDESRFLSSLRLFLLQQGVDMAQLTASWGRICDVPSDARSKSTFSVREAFRHINTFRNRFAHVPFPYDELDELALALARVTDQVFGLAPQPWQSFSDERVESPLNGAILTETRRLRGCQVPESLRETVPCWSFCFPALPRREPEHAEVWEAVPFVWIDSMRRSSILTRLRSEGSGVWEFTRFRAERNSVISVERPEWLQNLPAPTVDDYPTPPEEERQDAEAVEVSTVNREEPSTTDIRAQFEEALRSIANDDFEPAIAVLSGVVERLPGYHIGWLRLGYAQRELAMRKRFAAPDESRSLFSASIDSLTRATQHSQPVRSAQAYYERSKSYYHRGRLWNEPSDITTALTDARKAFSISPDTKYETWVAYVEQHAELKEGHDAAPESS